MAKSVPQIPEDEDMLADQRAGFDAFAAGRPLDTAAGAPWQLGWNMGWARCYAQGAVAFTIHNGDSDEVQNPYPQFSGAWEAWAHGFDEAIYL